MNTEQLVAELLQIVKSTKDFTLEHAPDVCSQIVTMGRVYTILYGVLLIGILTLFGRMVYVLKYMDEEFEEYEFIVTLLSVFIIPLGFIGMAIYLEAWIAPKLYLLNYLKDLL